MCSRSHSLRSSISDADLTSDAGIDALLAYLSDYDWRSGKYSGGEHRDLYAKYMRLSMGRLLFHLREDGLLYGSADTATTRRDAFAHSLCTHAVKCKLEIEYIPLSRDAALRAIVTGGVRYTENRLRALFGVKSRLLVRDFDDKYKRTIDRFFDGLIEGAKRKMAKREEPEYYSLYDAPSTGISISGADEIERDSWSTTARLVPEDEIDFVTPTVSEQNTPDIAEKVDALPCNENTADTYGLSVADIRALNSLLHGESSITDPTLAERINESFYDGFGDVILEECSGSYTIIEDYYEEVAEWLSTQTI